MENKKFPYEEPEMTIMVFSSEDIITTSGGAGQDLAELEEIPD